ncbi:MAG: serine hydrolase domain-containing protein, partial [Bacillota bacterium]
MKKRISMILIIALVMMSINASAVFAGGQRHTSVNYDSVKTKAQQMAEILVTGYGETSVQYALITDGEIVLSGNAGVFSKSGNGKLTADSMYGIGSVSKVFTAAAMMKLAERGKVNLDSTVTKYLPDFQMADDRYKEITVRMLLNHSSGLMGSSFENAFLMNDNDSYVRDHLLENLKNQRLKADPGAYSVYCNDGFTLAELVIEKVSGKTFSEFINQNFSDHLGMNRTKTPEDDFDRGQLSATYFPGFEDQTPIDSVNAIGAGGIYSTAEDLCRFARIFMENGGYCSVLSKHSAEATMAKEYQNGMWPQVSDNFIGYGLGWDSVDAFPMNRYDIKALTKGGDTLQYHTSFVVLPEHNMAMAVLSSSGSSVYNQAFAMKVLLEALEKKGEIERKADVTFQPAQKAVMPSKMLGYSGIYASSTVLMKSEITADGTLCISLPSLTDYPTQELVYTADGDFETSDGSGAIGFVKGKNGHIYMTNSGYSSLPGLGQIAVMEYSAEKTEPVVMSESTKAAWEKRDGMFYYIINEKYTSQIYASMLPVAGVGFLEEAPGYLASNKIVDENNAVAFVQIPGTAGRDMHDYTFFSEGDKDYLKYGSTLLISDDYINDIYTKGKAVCTIQADGYARWFHVNPADEGKALTVSIPDKAAFAVYDENRNCIQHSVIDGKNT